MKVKLNNKQKDWNDPEPDEVVELKQWYCI